MLSRAQTAILADTVRDLTLPYSLAALLEIICRRVRETLELAVVYVALRGEECEDEAVHVRALDGESATLTVGLRLAGNHEPPARGLGLPAPLWTADYLADGNIAHASAIDAVVRAEGLRAAIAVPLGDGDRPPGVLCGAAPQRREFTPGQVTLIRALGNLAAVAVERARSIRAVRTLAETGRHAALQNRLTTVLLNGATTAEFTEAAAGELGGTLQLLDPEGRLIAAARAHAVTSGPDPELVARAAAEAHAGNVPVPFPDGGWVAPIRAGERSLGALVLHTVEPGAGALLVTAARAFALLMMPRRGTVAVRGPAGDELLEDLVADPPWPPDELAERGRALGVDLHRPHVVVVARPEGGPQGRAVVWASSYVRRLQGLKLMDGGRIVLLVPGDDPNAAARRVCAELTNVLGHPVTAGSAGPVTDPARVRAAHLEAVRCLETVTALGGKGAAASAHDLGFLSVLLAEDQDIDGFIGSVLGPVMDSDGERSTSLVRTLDALFEAGGSRNLAAEALHVHPNTVSRRLERIAQLLGPQWQKPSAALEIQLALSMLRTRRMLCSDRSGSAPPPRGPAKPV